MGCNETGIRGQRLPNASPPGARNSGWAVYRIDFDDGTAYVGITSKPVEDRIQEHLGLLFKGGWCRERPRRERWLLGWGTRCILCRHAKGIGWTWCVIADGLSRREAHARERVEIEACEIPLHARSSRRPPCCW